MDTSYCITKAFSLFFFPTLFLGIGGRGGSEEHLARDAKVPGLIALISKPCRSNGKVL
jgi:hypothetical protein